jgi:5-methyltetrahydropteroyltriglutamate--homocysteine methyltransferase
MRRSEERILTTHAGSLPRPPELVRLYVRRAQGEAVDAGELALAGRAALRQVVAKQLDAGVDVGNNG